MSGNDNTNWDDHLDFESLADEHDAELGNSEPDDGSSDLTDLSYDTELAEGKAASEEKVADQAIDQDQDVGGVLLAAK